MNDSITKICSKCKECKSLASFSKDITRKDGHLYICKSCASARNKDYDKRNKNIRREKQRKYIEENKDLLRERARIWSLNHKEKKTSHARNRRAWKKNSLGTITLNDWKELCNFYGNKCLCCGKHGIPLTLDHVIPLSKGGANTIENSQPLCKPCNSGKRDKTIDYRPLFNL